MKSYAIDHHFTHGEWSYQAGEVLSVDDLAARGLVGAELDRRQQRGGIREISTIEDLDPVEGEARATFDEAARARAEAILTTPDPEPPADPE